MVFTFYVAADCASGDKAGWSIFNMLRSSILNSLFSTLSSIINNRYVPLPFMPVSNLSPPINVQYERLGYCRFLANEFGVQLNFDNLPKRNFQRNTHLYNQIMNALEERGIKRVIFDEAQRQIGLVKFIAKEPMNRPLFIITGTPPHGNNAINYGDSVSARITMVNLAGLRPSEVKQLLIAIFNCPVSSICILNFWTMFGGDAHLYQVFAKMLFVSIEENIRADIALGEKFPKDLLDKCINDAKSAIPQSGINPGLFDVIPETGANWETILPAFQRDVNQLLHRDLLKKVPYFFNSEQSRVIWNYNQVFFGEKSWARCRGQAMESIVHSFVDETLFLDNGDRLKLKNSRYDVVEYFYEGTDADVLLREKTPSLDRLDHTWKRHWVVFNIKTASESLFSSDSVKKFTRLCNEISFKENKLGDDVSLILVAAEINDLAKKNLLVTWNDFDVLGVLSLEDLFRKIPQPAVKRIGGLQVVERVMDKDRLKKSVHPTISLSGKYRCGKTTLLNECYRNDNDCIFIELPEGNIEPLSLGKENI